MSKRRNNDDIDNTKSYSALPFKIAKSNLEISRLFSTILSYLKMHQRI
jgi:hypothetical protein